MSAVVLVYDLEGFSRFVNHPDVARYIPRFLNYVSNAMQTVVFGGHPYWTETGDYEPVAAPVHEKFLGDGALYLWTGTEKHFVRDLCNRLRDLRTNFHEIVRQATDIVPITEVPRQVRFGIARGDVYELRRNDDAAKLQSREYVGMCINLASRLQNYCPDVRLTISARAGMNESTRDKNDYVRVIAKRIKGFTPEYVILDRAEYEALSRATREKYFTEGE